MKANQVQAKPTEVEVQSCVSCGRQLKAPWGRVDGGKKWVCSKTCNDLHHYGVDHNVALIRRLTAT